VHVQAEDADRTRLRWIERVEDPESGGLTGAVRAEQTEALARGDSKVKAVDREMVAEPMTEPGDLDGRRWL
jgi:hypothetical protein